MNYKQVFGVLIGQIFTFLLLLNLFKTACEVYPLKVNESSTHVCWHLYVDSNIDSYIHHRQHTRKEYHYTQA